MKEVSVTGESEQGLLGWKFQMFSKGGEEEF